METNSLIYREAKSNVELYGTKVDITVKIQLNDECKNGHQDFSITADIYEHGKPRIDKYFMAGGCCHEEIEKFFPKFKMFIDLHLADYNGVPMYAVANGIYHVRNGFNKVSIEDPSFPKEFCKYYRITMDQFNILKNSVNKIEYAINLKELGIIRSWKLDAIKAIEELERLTGNKFINDSIKTQLDFPTDDDIENYTKLKESGYYSREAIIERKKQEAKNKRNNLVNNIINDYKKSEEKAAKERDLKLWIVRHIDRLSKKKLLVKKGFNVDIFFSNYIYYNHTNEVKFNWKEYDHPISSEGFKIFCDNINENDFNKLPNGISFKCGSLVFTNK